MKLLLLPVMSQGAQRVPPRQSTPHPLVFSIYLCRRDSVFVSFPVDVRAQDRNDFFVPWNHQIAPLQRGWPSVSSLLRIIAPRPDRKFFGEIWKLKFLSVFPTVWFSQCCSFSWPLSGYFHLPFHSRNPFSPPALFSVFNPLPLVWWHHQYCCSEGHLFK